MSMDELDFGTFDPDFNFDLTIDNGRTDFTTISGTTGDPVLSANYTVDPTTQPALETCLTALSGVSIQYSSGSLHIRVSPPFDSAQLDKAKDAVVAVDPTAVLV